MLSEYTPMAPTRVREPFHREDWVYEEKVDGWRMLAYKDGDRVRLVSRNGCDHTRRFRDVSAAVSKLPARSLVLDGEVAIFDQQLRSRFEWLREPDPVPLPHRPCLSCSISFTQRPRSDRTAAARTPHSVGGHRRRCRFGPARATALSERTRGVVGGDRG